MIEFQQFFRQRKCSRCSKLHLTEDYFCEHCLYDLLDDVDGIGNDVYALWMKK